MPCPRKIFIVAALTLVALGAQAHDTWFQPLIGSSDGRTAAGAPRIELALGTGNRYPVQETGVGAEYLERQGCQGSGDQAAARPMQPARNIEHALVLRPPPEAARCWAQLVPLDIELDAAKVAVYLQEVQASPALRAFWREMQARGLPWRERYTKHARIDLDPEVTAGAQDLGLRVPMAMDIVRQPRQGAGFGFQVLQGGAPLAQQAMELVSEAGTRGIWRRSDGQGLVEFPPLPAGRWLLRGTWLRLADEDPTRWDSGFVTLAFEVAAGPLMRPMARPVSSAAR